MLSYGVDAVTAEFTEGELRALKLLGQAFDAFAALPVMHHADVPEFVHRMHALQNIVMQRPGARILAGNGH